MVTCKHCQCAILPLENQPWHACPKHWRHTHVIIDKNDFIGSFNDVQRDRISRQTKKYEALIDPKTAHLIPALTYNQVGDEVAVKLSADLFGEVMPPLQYVDAPIWPCLDPWGEIDRWFQITKQTEVVMLPCDTEPSPE